MWFFEWKSVCLRSRDLRAFRVLLLLPVLVCAEIEAVEASSSANLAAAEQRSGAATAIARAAEARLASVQQDAQALHTNMRSLEQQLVVARGSSTAMHAKLRAVASRARHAAAGVREGRTAVFSLLATFPTELAEVRGPVALLDLSSPAFGPNCTSVRFRSCRAPSCLVRRENRMHL